MQTKTSITKQSKNNAKVTFIKLLILFFSCSHGNGSRSPRGTIQWMLTLSTFKRYQVDSAIVSTENAFSFLKTLCS